MPSPCINDGGPSSLVRLSAVPILEEETLFDAKAARALRCWQARPGEIVTVCDPENTFYRARLTDLSGQGGRAVPFEVLPGPVESPVAVTVFQALPQRERLELILEKLTEIGVARICPFVSVRSITLAERDARQKKSHRWPEVILRAARQCRRGMIPELYPVLSWDETLYRAHHDDLKLMLCEKGAAWTLKEALRADSPHRVALLVGPEGGFTEEERAEARDFGVLPVSLGSRILRTETAAIVGAALIQYALGDLG